MGHVAGFLGVAAGATLAVRAMDVHSPEEFRDAVRAAAQPTAEALRSRATGVKIAIQVRCAGTRLVKCWQGSASAVQQMLILL